MIIPLEGSAGIFGPSCPAVAELAAAEFNEENGVLGRQVELEFIDAGHPPREVAARVAALAANDRLDAVTGWHISSVRHARCRRSPEAALCLHISVRRW
jgi:ABC-type branched-subunit amino acid transport system substrate-binding protein